MSYRTTIRLPGPGLGASQGRKISSRDGGAKFEFENLSQNFNTLISVIRRELINTVLIVL
jgi:hypothetical protein